VKDGRYERGRKIRKRVTTKEAVKSEEGWIKASTRWHKQKRCQKSSRQTKIDLLEESLKKGKENDHDGFAEKGKKVCKTHGDY